MTNIDPKVESKVEEGVEGKVEFRWDTTVFINANGDSEGCTVIVLRRGRCR